MNTEISDIVKTRDKFVMYTMCRLILSFCFEINNVIFIVIIIFVIFICQILLMNAVGGYFKWYKQFNLTISSFTEID